MLKFKLIENNDLYISYEYLPEGRKPGGLITMNKKNTDDIKKELALEDEFGSYACHMMSKMRKFIKEENYEETGMIARY